MYLSTEAARRHRARLANTLKTGDLVIVPAARLTTRNNDVHHRFRQDSDFYYLTRFLEPDAVAIIEPDKTTDYILFVLPES